MPENLHRHGHTHKVAKIPHSFNSGVGGIQCWCVSSWRCSLLRLKKMFLKLQFSLIRPFTLSSCNSIFFSLSDKPVCSSHSCWIVMLFQSLKWTYRTPYQRQERSERVTVGNWTENWGKRKWTEMRRGAGMRRTWVCDRVIIILLVSSGAFRDFLRTSYSRQASLSSSRQAACHNKKPTRTKIKYCSSSQTDFVSACSFYLFSLAFTVETNGALISILLNCGLAITSFDFIIDLVTSLFCPMMPLFQCTIPA